MRPECSLTKEQTGLGVVHLRRLRHLELSPRSRGWRWCRRGGRSTACPLRRRRPRRSRVERRGAPAQKHEPEDDHRKPRDGAGSLLGGYELNDVASRFQRRASLEPRRLRSALHQIAPTVLADTGLVLNLFRTEGALFHSRQLREGAWSYVAPECRRCCATWRSMRSGLTQCRSPTASGSHDITEPEGHARASPIPSGAAAP